MEQQVRARLSLDDFVELFVCALVIRGKTRISRRGQHFDIEDRPGLAAVRRYFVRLYQELDAKTEKEYEYFVVDVRNLFSQGTYGSFERFFWTFFQKRYLIREPKAYDEFYTFIHDKTSAQDALDAVSREMRMLVVGAADVYIGAKK